MRRIKRLSWLMGIFLVWVASASVRPPAIESSTWLNTTGGQPPTLVGRAVLVEFWTFG